MVTFYGDIQDSNSSSPNIELLKMMLYIRTDAMFNIIRIFFFLTFFGFKCLLIWSVTQCPVYYAGNFCCYWCQEPGFQFVTTNWSINSIINFLWRSYFLIMLFLMGYIKYCCWRILVTAMFKIFEVIPWIEISKHLIYMYIYS